MTAKKVVEPEVELDPATGFPVVPDGYFWRVGEREVIGWTPQWGTNYVFGVSLYRTYDQKTVVRKTLFRPERVECKPVEQLVARGYHDDEFSGTLKERLVAQAKATYLSWRASLERENLIGDYPPKGL